MADWEDQWTAAKKAFEAKTGQKKPSAQTMLGIRRGSGLEAALKLCDTTYAAIGAESKNPQKKLALTVVLANAIKAFDAKMVAYEKVLIASIAASDSKIVKPELDILLKQLHALSATMKAHQKAAAVAGEGAKALEFTAKTLITNVMGAIARAKLFAAKVLSGKDSKVFNAGIMTASRDITQYIGNVEKLRAKGFQFPKGDPTNLFKVFTPWSQGNRKLPDNAPIELVKRETGAFLQAVEGVNRWTQGGA